MENKFYIMENIIVLKSGFKFMELDNLCSDFNDKKDFYFFDLYCGCGVMLIGICLGMNLVGINFVMVCYFYVLFFFIVFFFLCSYFNVCFDRRLFFVCLLYMCCILVCFFVWIFFFFDCY